MIAKVGVSGLSALAALLLSGSSMAADGQNEGDRSAESGEEESRENAPVRGMNNSVSVLASLGYAYAAGTGFGLSGRFQHTLSENGLLRNVKIHDDIGIEGSLDFNHYSWNFYGYEWSYNEIGVAASAVWNFWFSPEFAIYPRLGLGYAFGSWSDNSGLTNPDGYGGIYFVGGAGLLYELEAVTLRAEVSNAALNLGVSFSL
jgi:hypothetical protein